MKITELPPAIVVSSDNIIAVVQDGQTKQATVGLLTDLISANVTSVANEALTVAHAVSAAVTSVNTVVATISARVDTVSAAVTSTQTIVEGFDTRISDASAAVTSVVSLVAALSAAVTSAVSLVSSKVTGPASAVIGQIPRFSSIDGKELAESIINDDGSTVSIDGGLSLNGPLSVAGTTLIDGSLEVLGNVTVSLGALFVNGVDIETEISDISNRVSAASASLTSSNAVIAAVSTRVDTVSAAVTSVITRINTVSGLAAAASAAVTSVNTVVATISAAVTSVITRVNTVSGLAAAASAAVTSVNTVVATLSGRVDTASAAITSVITRINTVSASVTSLANVVSALEVRVSALSAGGVVSGTYAVLNAANTFTSGDQTITCALLVQGVTVLGGQVITSSTLLVGTALTVSSITNLRGTVSVSGATTFRSTVAVCGALTVSGVDVGTTLATISGNLVSISNAASALDVRVSAVSALMNGAQINIFAGGSNPSTALGTVTSTYFSIIGYGATGATAAGNWVFLSPVNGAIKSWNTYLDAQPGAGATRTLTLTRNGVATALSNVYAASVSGTLITSGSIVMSVGTRFEVLSQLTGVPTNSQAGWSITFVISG